MAIIAFQDISGQQVKDTLHITSLAEQPLYKHLYIYKTDDDLPPSYIFDSVTKPQFSRPFTDKSFSERLNVGKHYWLLCTIKSHLAEDAMFYYQLNSQTPDIADGYIRTQDGNIKFWGNAGKDVLFDELVYPFHNIVFPIDIKAGKTVQLLLNLSNQHGQNISLLPQLTNGEKFKAEEQQFYTVTGVMTGIMVTVFLLNLFLGVSLRDKMHLLYGLYIVVALFEILIMTGIDRQFLYPHLTNEFVSSHITFITPTILSILMILTMQLFLKQTKDNSRVFGFVEIIKWAIISSLVFYGIRCWFFINNREVMGVYEITLCILFLLAFLGMAISAVEKVIHGYRPAWFYLAATLYFATGLIQYILVVMAGTNQEQVFKQYPNNIQKGFVVETVVIFLGIVYRYNLFKKEKEKLLQQVNQQQQELIDKIVAVQEAERKRIAEDLHDDLGATLSALSLQISNGKQESQGELNGHYENILNLTNKAVNDIRNIAHNLLPKDFIENGLFKVLESRIAMLNDVGKINFSLVTDGDEKRLTDITAITIYRIADELLTNITRHSGASHSTLQVLVDKDCIQLLTEDNGNGFDTNAEKKGIGLKNISSRVNYLKGRVDIESNNDGSQTLIFLPL